MTAFDTEMVRALQTKLHAVQTKLHAERAAKNKARKQLHAERVAKRELAELVLNMREQLLGILGEPKDQIICDDMGLVGRIVGTIDDYRRKAEVSTITNPTREQVMLLTSERDALVEQVSKLEDDLEDAVAKVSNLQDELEDARSGNTYA